MFFLVLAVGLCVVIATAGNRTLALEKMASEGAEVTSTEMALFEMLEQAGSEEFKAISKLVR